MACGAPIGAVETQCTRCGTSFAREAPRTDRAAAGGTAPLGCNTPSAGDDDDPRTVVVFEVPSAAPAAGPDPSRLGARGTVPIRAEDLPTQPRRKSQGTMILVNAAPVNAAPVNAAPGNAAPVNAASVDAAPIEPAPDSHTTIMALPAPRPAERPPPTAALDDESTDGPASLTRPGLEPFPHLAPKPPTHQRDDPGRDATVAFPATDAHAAEPFASGAAVPHESYRPPPHESYRPPPHESYRPPPHESYRPPSGAPLAEAERPMPQHYSMPPAALLPEEALPSPALEAPEDLAPLTTGFPPHAALPELGLPPMVQPSSVSPTDPMNGLPSGLRDASTARGEAAMSMVAGTAKIISEAFNMGFGSSIPGWRTEVAAPMGMSTEGGKQALLPITLVNDAGQRIAIGSVDTQQRRVTLKTHRTLGRSYAQRYNRGFDVSPEQHAAMLDSIQSFFSAMHFTLVMDEGPLEPLLAPTDPAMDAAPRRWLLWMVVGACVLAVVVWLAVR